MLLRMPGGMNLLRRLRSYRFYKRVGGIKSSEDIFTHIYHKNRWGNGESLSGSGSTIQYTENIRKEIPQLINKLGVHRLLDAPCGDYNWFRLIPRNEGVFYIGGDIVKSLILRNQETFGNANTRFMELDITGDPLPGADLWMCRDALLHFSFRDIFRTVDNFLRSDIKYFLASSHTEWAQNTDIPTGSFRLLNLELPPFNFCKPTACIDDWIEGHPVRKLCLWEKQTLHDCLASNKGLSRMGKHPIPVTVVSRAGEVERRSPTRHKSSHLLPTRRVGDRRSTLTMRLGILTSHPIQYQAPWFRALAKVVDLEVFFAHRQSAAEQGKAGFGVAFEWDVDLLSGYRHRFLKNVSSKPGVGHFFGCDTPEIAEIIRGRGPQDYGPRTADQGTTSVQKSVVSSQGSVVSGPVFDAFVVTGWHLKSYWQAVRACRRTGVPVLVRGDSQLLTPRSLLKRWAKELVHRVLLRQFDGFLTVGQRNREYLAHYGVLAEKIFFTPHFVDNEWFRGKAEIARKQKAEIRKEWGANDEDNGTTGPQDYRQTLVVLFVGKFITKKRPLDLLRALRTLNSQPSTFNFLAVFVGSGELEGTLRAEAEALKVRTHFAGFKNQSELPRYYAAADVLVLPSDGGETWGLVVNEAMACGLPAVVSDAVGCAPDLIEEGRTGFAFPVGDCEQLASRLASLAEMKSHGHDLAAALTEKMRVYSVNNAVEGTIRAVTVLSGNKDAPHLVPFPSDAEKSVQRRGRSTDVFGGSF